MMLHARVCIWVSSTSSHNVMVIILLLALLTSPWLVDARLVDQDEPFLTADPNAPSSKGNEFVLGFMGNKANAPVDSATAALYVTTDDPDPVEFTVEYFGRVDTYEARRGRATLARLPVSKVNAEDIRIMNKNERNKGVRVKTTNSSKLLTVYGINDAAASTDMFLALPCHRYSIVDYGYFVFSTFTQISTGTFQSRFLIVPCEDDTTVTLQPTQQIQVEPDLTGQIVPQNINPGGSTSITMNRLQTAQFNSANDLTGTIITSDKPISVFVGHECGQVPGNRTACNHLVEQVPPYATWGTQFFTVPLDVRESGERYRVGTIADNNQVTITCTTEGQTTPRLQMTQTLPSQRGQNYFEFDLIGDNTIGVTNSYRRDFCCIETSKPAIVMMYSKGHSVDEIMLPNITGTQGDPFMLLVPPVSQYSNDYTVTTAKQLRTDFIGHISLTIPIQFFDNSTVDRSLLTVNGTTVMPDSGYQRILCANNQTCGYGAYSSLPVGDHLVSYDKSGAAINLFVYGFHNESSFGYPAGFEMQAAGAPRISIFNITVLESTGTVRIPINRTGGDLSLISVIRATSRDVPGQAVAPQDYQPLSNFRIRWLRGAVDPRYIPNPTGHDPAFEFTIINDNTREPTEYFEIDLIPNPGGNGNAFFYPSAVGRVTIIDDDSPPEIGFVPETYVYNENDGVARLTIRTNMPERFTDATGALFYTDDGNATGGGVDYTGYTRANAVPIMFPAGSIRTTIEVPIINDQLIEGTERFFGRIITGGGISSLNIFAPTARVDIKDSDRLIFGFEQPEYTFSESVGTINLSVRLSPESGWPTENFVFTFSTADGLAISPDDFASATVQYTFVPGRTRLDIPITIVDDSNFEGTEQFLGNLSTFADAIIDVPQTTITIADNDSPMSPGNTTATVTTSSPPLAIATSSPPLAPDPPTGPPTSDSSSDNTLATIGGMVVALVTVIVTAVTILIAIALILRSRRAEFSPNQKATLPYEPRRLTVLNNLSHTNKERDIDDTLEANHEYEILDKYAQAYDEVEVPPAKSESVELQKLSSVGDCEFTQCPAYVSMATTSIHGNTNKPE